MAKNLVIVESPAKAKTIEKFLGSEFQVESSYGHIADLPSKEIGVDVANGFKPKYEVSSDKKALVKKLKDLSKNAETVWLASDEDREGEAISWHLAEELKLDKSKTKRIVFHEITKSAIQKAIENPRGIDYNLVNAQQARRVLDRLVGYELSPVLWKKVKGGLSAGRVQSVSVRLIVEREREIQEFKAVASYSVTAEFTNEAGKVVKAKLPKNFVTKKEAEDFLQKNIGSTYKVADLETKPTKKSPAAPFTTSTLQQEAARKLYFPVGITMQIAQRLYEAGLITYMRTDSVNLSQEAMAAAQAEITSYYGAEYSKPRNYNTKSKGAQEAHEAIRPTDMSRHTVNVERDQARLYELIWKRTLASQMADAELERTNVKIEANNHSEVFQATGEVIKFEGFLKVYLEGNDDDDEEQEGMLPALKVNEKLINHNITATERYSRPPSRYTEASLVKKLEELGIGRPSTYAPTISTIQKRGYVEKREREGEERKYTVYELKKGAITSSEKTEVTGRDKNKLSPTDIGVVVTDFLEDHFAKIMDYHFTAEVEEKFDKIAQGLTEWTKMIHDFYNPFHANVEDTLEHSDRATGERELGVHPDSGKKIIARIGRFGPMIQIGDEQTDGEKPQFASLRGEQSINSITLEEALELFKLPRTLGEFEEQVVKANIGRFGPYIQHGKIFASIPKGEDPMTVTYDRAVEILKEKQEADANKIIKIFPEDENVQLLNGRWGAYLKIGKNNYKLPKTADPEKLTYEECIEISQNQEKPKGKGRATKTTKAKKK